MFIVISQVKEMKCDSEFSVSKCDHSVHVYIRKSVIPKHTFVVKASCVSVLMFVIYEKMFEH